jgi:hypothetical protein
MLGGNDPLGVGRGDLGDDVDLPSPPQISSRASAGGRSLRNTTRSRRGPRWLFQWSWLASSTTRSLPGAPVSSQTQVKGSAWISPISFSSDEKPSTSVYGPVPHGPGASITHQSPSAEPRLR